VHRTSSARAWGIGGAVLAALLAVHSPARAADGLSLTATECPDLDESEIARLLEIELGSTIFGRGEPLRVELRCEGPNLRIVAIDPITEKRLEREVELGVRPLQADRVVAILISQLFLSSWSELLLEPPRDVEPSSMPKLKSTPLPAVTELAERRTREALAPSTSLRRWEVAVMGGPRVRELTSPLVAGRLAIRPSFSVGALSLFAEFGVERGSVSRSAGAIDASLMEGVVGISLRAMKRGPFTLDLELSGGPTWMDLWGANAQSGVQTGSVSGVVAEAAAGVAPGLRLGPVHAALLLQGGANLSQARVLVAGESDVSLAGPWVGASLLLGLAE
jgi:hypothetical protein